MQYPLRNESAMNRESLAKIDQLCHWIEANCAQAINREDLIVQSGLNHQDLIKLFSVYKKITPMGYVRRCREMMQKKSD